jgi:hypothetical protein
MVHRVCAHVCMVAACLSVGVVASASAAVTPGWECIPTTAGQAVVSGGTAASPSCGAGQTPVLAPTYVASGVGGKPTVQFASVNVQIINGSGSTATNNATGNLVLGYDESPGSQTGSHNLILGGTQTATGHGDIVAGYENKVTGNWGIAAGDRNTVGGTASAALGGYDNVVSSSYSSLAGGCSNRVGTSSGSISSLCTNTATYAHDFAFAGGGMGNQATGIESSVTGGSNNVASAQAATVTAGEFNIANDELSFIGGGCDDITGSGTANSNVCDAGGEDVSGGASVSAQSTDMTAGAITDGVNSGKAGDFKISIGLGAGACSVLPFGVPGTKVGDLATIAYETNPPPGLLIQTTGVTVAGQVEVEACNVSSATIQYNNIPIRVQTFR